MKRKVCQNVRDSASETENTSCELCMRKQKKSDKFETSMET